MIRLIGFIIILASVFQLHGTLQLLPKKCQTTINTSYESNIICRNATFQDLTNEIHSTIWLPKTIKPFNEPEMFISIIFMDSVFDEIKEDDFITIREKDTFNFKNNIIKTFHIEALKYINTFEQNSIDRILKNNTEQIRYMRDISISNNKINRFEPGVFENSAVSTLKLTNNQLTDLKPGVFVNLNNIEKIKLNNNNLTKLRANTFANFTKTGSAGLFKKYDLTSIDLSFNQIQTIEQNAFYNLFIEKIDLQYNNLTAIGNNLFTNVNLTILLLAHNQISYISPQAFEKMSSLIMLKLSNNQIKTLPARLFYTLNNLNILSLIDNPIESIQPDAFYGLHGLNMDYNGIDALLLGHFNVSTIQMNAFNGLYSLTRLDLSNWNISKIEAKAFYLMRDIKSLLLNDNQLTDIIPGTFNGLEKIDLIDLSNNQLTKLTKDMFEGLNGTKFLPQLELETKERVITLKELFYGDLDLHKSSMNLILKHNRISSIDRDAFTYLANLKLLDISENKLTNIAIGTFKGLKFVGKLDLHMNNLTSLEKEVLYPIVRLEDLNVANNELETLDIRSILDHSMNDAFKVINLNHNNWKCDELRYMLMALTESKVDFISSSPEYFDSHNVHGIRCIPEKEDKILQSGSRSESPEVLFINYQKDLVSTSKSQLTVLIFLCFFYLLTSILLIALYILRNKSYFNGTLRGTRNEFNQSTVELLNVPQ